MDKAKDNNVKAWRNLGIQLSDAPNEIPLAIHRFEKSITMNRNSLNFYITTVQTGILKKASIFDRAVAAYLRTLNLSPNNCGCTWKFGRYILRLRSWTFSSCH